MVGFFRKRNFAAATVVVLVLLLTAACEARLSYSFTFGSLDALVNHDNWLLGMMAALCLLTTSSPAQSLMFSRFGSGSPP